MCERARGPRLEVRCALRTWWVDGHQVWAGKQGTSQPLAINGVSWQFPGCGPRSVGQPQARKEPGWQPLREQVVEPSSRGERWPVGTTWERKRAWEGWLSNWPAPQPFSSSQELRPVGTIRLSSCLCLLHSRYLHHEFFERLMRVRQQGLESS